MASLSTRRSITLLAVIGGSLVRIDECRMFSVVAMKEMVKKTYRDTINIMNTWPDGERTDEDATWIDERIVKWGEYLHGVKEHHTLPVFATVCSRCLDDLKTVIKNRTKLRKLQVLEEPIQKIVKFIDPELYNFPAMDKANMIMDELYNLIEWEWPE